MRRLIALIALLPAVALAQVSDDRDAALPPFPTEKNLVRVAVDGMPGYEVFIDIESLNVGADGVVRYTYVAKTRGGGSNIAYEGLRCKDRERMVYAYGLANGTWAPPRDQKWVPVSNLPANRIQATLSDEFFCPALITVRSTAEARNRIKWGGVRRCTGDATIGPDCPDR